MRQDFLPSGSQAAPRGNCLLKQTSPLLGSTDGLSLALEYAELIMVAMVSGGGTIVWRTCPPVTSACTAPAPRDSELDLHLKND